MSETDDMVQALDPFVAAAYRQRQGVRPEAGRQAGPATHVLENYLPHTAKNMMSLPQRATEAAGSLQRGGDYDPGPALETAMLMAGSRMPTVKSGELGAGGGKLNFTKDFNNYQIYDDLGPIGNIAPSKNGTFKVNVAGDTLDAHSIADAHNLAKKMYEGLNHDPGWDKKLENSPFNEKGSYGIIPQKSETIAQDYYYKWKDKTDDILFDWNRKRLERAYDKKITPYSWADTAGPNSPPIELPPHAVELGFNPNKVLYKGGNYYKNGAPRTRLMDPSDKLSEPGLFFAPNHHIAEAYGDVTQYVANPKNAAMANWSDFSPNNGYSSQIMDPLVRAARSRGHDMLVVKDLYDMGQKSPQSQYVVLDPSIVRYPHAKFDPTKIGTNDLLAGITGGGIAAGTAMDPDVLSYIKALKK